MGTISSRSSRPNKIESHALSACSQNLLNLNFLVNAGATQLATSCNQPQDWRLLLCVNIYVFMAIRKHICLCGVVYAFNAYHDMIYHILYMCLCLHRSQPYNIHSPQTSAWQPPALQPPPPAASSATYSPAATFYPASTTQPRLSSHVPSVPPQHQTPPATSPTT